MSGSSKLFCDYAVVSLIDNNFAVLNIENTVSTPVYHRGGNLQNTFGLQDRVIVRYTQLGRLNRVPGIPNQFRYVTENVIPLTSLRQDIGEIQQLKDTFGFIVTKSGEKVHFTIRNTAEAKEREDAVSLKNIYKENLQVHFRAVAQVPEHNCAWRAVEVSKYPLKTIQLKPCSVVPPKMPPVAVTVVNDVEGIIFQAERDRVFVWSREVGRILFPREAAADAKIHPIMSKTYGIGKWVKMNVKKKSPVEECYWETEYGVKLIGTKLQIHKYPDDEFEITALGRIVTVHGRYGIVWSEELGRVLFSAKTTDGKGNELEPGDLWIDRIVEITVEAESIQPDLHWRANKFDLNINSRQTEEVPPVRRVKAYFVAIDEGYEGHVILYSEEVGEHIYMTPSEFFEDYPVSTLEGIAGSRTNFEVLIVPALVTMPQRWRAAYIKPLNDIPKNADESDATSREAQHSSEPTAQQTGRNSAVMEARINRNLEEFDKQLERSRVLKEDSDLRAFLMLTEEHKSFMKKVEGSILSTNEWKPSDVSTSYPKTLCRVQSLQHMRQPGQSLEEKRRDSRFSSLSEEFVAAPGLTVQDTQQCVQRDIATEAESHTPHGDMATEAESHTGSVYPHAADFAAQFSSYSNSGTGERRTVTPESEFGIPAAPPFRPRGFFGRPSGKLRASSVALPYPSTRALRSPFQAAPPCFAPPAVTQQNGHSISQPQPVPADPVRQIVVAPHIREVAEKQEESTQTDPTSEMQFLQNLVNDEMIFVKLCQVRPQLVRKIMSLGVVVENGCC